VLTNQARLREQDDGPSVHRVQLRAGTGPPWIFEPAPGPSTVDGREQLGAVQVRRDQFPRHQPGLSVRAIAELDRGGPTRIDDHGQPLRITARTGCGAT
jgi:hypothetical protein